MKDCRRKGMEGSGILAGAGYLQDFAKLYCLYPGW
jgi:hypothetical protein